MGIYTIIIMNGIKLSGGFFATNINTDIKNKNYEILQFLIDHNAINFRDTDKNGNTILHTAVEKENHVAIKIILDFIKKNNLENIINIQNNNGDTALHISLKNNSGHVIANLLIDYGADTSITNNNGESVGITNSYNEYLSKIENPMQDLHNSSSSKVLKKIPCNKKQKEKKSIQNMLQMYTDTQSSDTPLPHLSIVSDKYFSPEQNFIPTKSIGMETSEYLPMTENVIDSATSINS